MKAEQTRYELLKLNKKSVAGTEYDIVYHRLEFWANPESSGDFYGKVTSYFKPQIDNFNNVKFDFVNTLTVDSILYHGQSLQNFSLSSVRLAIDLPQNIQKGNLDSITVYYHGRPWEFTNRSFTREKNRVKDTTGVIFTLSEPYGARDWWPCKQSLDDKIDSLDVLLTIPKGMKAASNGVLLYEKEVNDSQIVVHWKHRYPIVTYLVAIAVTNYAEFSDWAYFPDGDSIEILNYIYPESIPSERSRAARTPEMMLLFDSLFGEYPFMQEKYGHAQFGFGGGMEHQTMSFMGDWNFGLVAHELAHQWFGNQVTCGSWQDLWLNESFATHLTMLSWEFLEPTYWKPELRRISRNIRSENDGSVYVYGGDTSNVGRLFSGRLTYHKGAYVLRMLRWKLGDDVYFEACRKFLNDPSTYHEFARTSDFQRVFEAVSGEDLQDFMDSWIFGEGFPTYELIWGIDDNLVNLTIKQSTSHPSVGFYNIPVELRFFNESTDSIIVVNPETNVSQFSFKLPFQPDSLEFDPNLWLLAKHSVLHNEHGDNNITIYPNPGNEQLSILYAPHQMDWVRLYDAMGRLVMEKEIELKSLSEVHLDVTPLRAGMYTVRIGSEGLVYTEKFIKTTDQ